MLKLIRKLFSFDSTFNKYEKNVKEFLLRKSNVVIAFLGAGDIDSEFNFFK